MVEMEARPFVKMADGNGSRGEIERRYLGNGRRRGFHRRRDSGGHGGGGGGGGGESGGVS
ncbi:unnamed protein product [Spirodela intermedia]|uniref:Uncharacterized protein n=1 Tax=Spirodela intermedia TaxID=51605 RepID=A0ABN7E9W9_SPIIN|nr:unnamed protein product [Spirodela intermedia]